MNTCIDCGNKKDRKSRLNIRCSKCIAIINNKLIVELNTLKLCSCCNKEKLGKKFKRLKNKLPSEICLSCHNNAYRRNNTEVRSKLAASQKVRRDKLKNDPAVVAKWNYKQRLAHNKEKEQAYRFSKRGREVYNRTREKYHNDQKRRAEHKERNKQWRLNNPEASRAITAKRRAAKLQRTPKWANLKAIKQFYLNCPKGMHVDHIIPLQGETVCGFHVEYNLQYLSPLDNSKKGAKLIV